MWNAVSITDDSEAVQPFTLSSDISAIELVSIENGRAVLGPVSKIPQGAEIRHCGDGFNERTVKVSWEGHFYFLFLEDLEAQRKPVARSASS